MKSISSLIRRTSRSLVLLGIVATGGSSRAADVEATSPPHLRLEGKMICIGDSITSGEGVKPAESYVGLLHAKVAAEKIDLQVIDQGRSGWSTKSYIENEETVVKAMPADATVVSIMLGTNDTREGGSPEEIGQRAAQNVGKMIDMYQAKAPHAQFIIICPTKCIPGALSKRLRDANYNERTPARLHEIEKQYQALATERGLLFIDLSELPSSAENSIDGIHPNAAGHQEIFDLIWRSLSAAAAPTATP